MSESKDSAKLESMSHQSSGDIWPVYLPAGSTCFLARPTCFSARRRPTQVENDAMVKPTKAQNDAYKKKLKEKKERDVQKALAASVFRPPGLTISVASTSSVIPSAYPVPAWPVTDSANGITPAVRATQVDSTPPLTARLLEGLEKHGKTFQPGMRCLAATTPFGGHLHTFLETDCRLVVCCNDAYRRAHFHEFAYNLESMQAICPTWSGVPGAQFEYLCASPPYNRKGENHREKEIVLNGVSLVTRMAVWKVTTQSLANYTIEEQPSFTIVLNQGVQNYPSRERGMFAECWAVWVK
jgi:hypothetical protein